MATRSQLPWLALALALPLRITCLDNGLGLTPPLGYNA